MHDETAPAPGERTEPAWLQVARATFRHHLRGPWFVALCLVGLLSPLLVLIVTFAQAGQDAPAWDVLPFLTNLPRTMLPPLLLLLVVSGFRGAWLRDPSAAGERVAGFFAGTWAALAASLSPWALASFALAAWIDAAWPALLATLLHGLTLALFMGAWTALWMLVAVAFRREETRWVAGGLALVVLTLALPNFRDLLLTLWRMSGSSFESDAAWAFVLGLLDPGRLQTLLASSIGPSSFETQPYREALPALFHPVTLLAAFALWIALPLALAIRAQRRAEDPVAPLEMPL